MSDPSIRTSVIIPAWRAWATLPAVLDALEPQVCPNREVIVIDSGADHKGDEFDRWPWVQAIVRHERLLPGEARNLASKVARGDVLAFLDADAIPLPDWLSRLEAALVPGIDAVAGAVLNGTPQSAVGTAGYLLEFTDFLPHQHALVHGASCNLLIRTATFKDTAGFDEDLWPGEDTVLTFRLAAAGRLAFAPDAAVRHLNRTAIAQFLPHQRRLGASFRRICQRVDFPYRRIGHPALAPLAAGLRLMALAKQLRPHPRLALDAVRLLPLLVLGLSAWAWGLIAGSASAPSS